MGKILSAFLAALLLVQPAFPAVSNADRALVERGQNGMTNGGFESGKNGWVASAGTFTTTTTSGNVDSGTTAGSWTASGAAGRTLDYAMTITSGGAFSGQNGVASCKFKAASGTATHTISVVDGSGNNLGNVNPITSSTVSYVRTSSNFVFPSSGTVKLRITTVSASEPQLFEDTCYFGTADGFNLFQISQASLVASGYIDTTASCTPTRTNTALGSFGTVAACPGPTVELNPGPGTLQTTDTDLPKFTLNGLPPGNYVVTMGVPYSNGTSTSAQFAINDGTTTSGRASSTDASATQGHATVVANFSYSNTANRTFELFGASTGTGTITLIPNANNRQITFNIVRFPSSGDLSYSSNQPLYPTVQKFTTTGSFTYTRPANVSYIKVKMVGAGGGGGGGGASGGGDGTAGGNTVFGTWTANGGNQGTKGNSTSGAGQGGAQPSFTVGAGNGNCWPGTAGNGGYYNVSASNFSFGGGGASVFGGGPGAVTGNTTGRSGSANTGSGGAGGGGVGAAGLAFGGGGSSGSYCEFTLNTPPVTISASLGAGGGGGSAATSGAAGGAGSDGYVEVWEYYGSQAPVSIGSVTSNSPGPERIERAVVNCVVTTGSITSQSGSWISGYARTGTGVCTANITGFSAAPTCTAADNGSGGVRFCAVLTTATTIEIDHTTNAAAADGSCAIICMGPR